MIHSLAIFYSFSNEFVVWWNFFGPFLTSWNNKFPCSYTFPNFSGIFWLFVLKFCCSCKVLNSLATKTWEVMLDPIWLNARPSKGSFGDTWKKFLMSIFFHIYKPSTRQKTRKGFIKKKRSCSNIETNNLLFIESQKNSVQILHLSRRETSLYIQFQVWIEIASLCVKFYFIKTPWSNTEFSLPQLA